MPTQDTISALRRRAAVARRVSKDVRAPEDAQALVRMADDLEAEADRLERETATSAEQPLPNVSQRQS